MSTVYVVKSFGRYHYFKTEEAREAYLKSIPEWEAKYAETYEQTYGVEVS